MLRKSIPFFAMALALAGSVATQTAMPMPAYQSTGVGGPTTGFWFQCPTNCVITGLEVPNEGSHAYQVVEVIDFGTTPPPAPFPGVQATQLFVDTAAPAGTKIATDIPLVRGRYYGVLGATMASPNSAPIYRSTALVPGGFTSRILGMDVPVDGLTTLGPISTTSGHVSVRRNPGGIGRVNVDVRIPSIDLPDYFYTSTNEATSWGYAFTAPVDCVLAGLELPDESGLGFQSVEVVGFGSSNQNGFGTQLYYGEGPSHERLNPDVLLQAGQNYAIVGISTTSLGGGVGDNSRPQFGQPEQTDILGQTVQLMPAAALGSIAASQGNLSIQSGPNLNLGRIHAEFLPVAGNADTLTIRDGAASFTQRGLSTNAGTIPPSDFDAGAGDVLFDHWWFYRLDGDPREYALFDDGDVSRYVTESGRKLVTVWGDVGGRGLLSARLEQSIRATGAGGAVLDERLVWTNLTANSITGSTIAYTDFDVITASFDIARGGPRHLTVLDANVSADPGVEVRTPGASGAAVAAYPAILNQLLNAVVDPIAGWSEAFGPGDFTGANAWSGATPPFGSAGVSAQLVVLNDRPASDLYGAGGAGTNGVPTILSDYPVQRETTTATRIKLRGALPNSLAVMQLNLLQTNQTIFGINVLVEQLGVINVVALADTNGAANYDLALPGGNDFVGLPMFSQWLVFDPGAANGTAATTAGLSLVLGAW